MPTSTIVPDRALAQQPVRRQPRAVEDEGRPPPISRLQHEHNPPRDGQSTVRLRQRGEELPLLAFTKVPHRGRFLRLAPERDQGAQPGIA